MRQGAGVASPMAAFSQHVALAPQQEPGGLTSRELQMILRGFTGLSLVGADVVEVAPAYDHAELTTIAAANTVYDLLALLALQSA